MVELISRAPLLTRALVMVQPWLHVQVCQMKTWNLYSSIPQVMTTP